MPLIKIFTTTTFRLAMAYMVLFAVSGFALLAFVYWSTAGYMARQTDATIAAEITGLTEQFQTGGIERLIQVIQSRSRAAGDSLYLLAREDRSRIAGNLSAWPDITPDEDGWIELEFERPHENGETATHMARGRVYIVQQRYRLLVGRDIEQRLQIVSTIRSSLMGAMGITAALGLFGGAFLARYTMGRLDEVNKAARQIMEGDLTHRVPVRGAGDEIDQMADNLNAMLDQIERLMMGMRQVTDNIAHDLRSPLNRLRSRIEVTLLEHEGEAAYRTALNQTISEADDIIRTFNALLSIAQVEAGTLRDDMVELDLGDIAQDVAELYEPLAEEKNMHLECEVGSGLVLKGNRELLSQSLANLLDNAIKYGPPDSVVRLRVQGDRQGISVTVADEGAGIPESERDNVTKRFVRLEQSRTEPGAGLGLSLVAATVKLHRGTLAMGEGPEGKGLTVGINLPR